MIRYALPYRGTPSSLKLIHNRIATDRARYTGNAHPTDTFGAGGKADSKAEEQTHGDPDN
jgi:hypothetical protein